MKTRSRSSAEPRATLFHWQKRKPKGPGGPHGAPPQSTLLVHAVCPTGQAVFVHCGPPPPPQHWPPMAAMPALQSLGPQQNLACPGMTAPSHVAFGGVPQQPVMLPGQAPGHCGTPMGEHVKGLGGAEHKDHTSGPPGRQAPAPQSAAVVHTRSLAAHWELGRHCG